MSIKNYKINFKFIFILSIFILLYIFNSHSIIDKIEIDKISKLTISRKTFNPEHQPNTNTESVELNNAKDINEFLEIIKNYRYTKKYFKPNTAKSYYTPLQELSISILYENSNYNFLQILNSKAHILMSLNGDTFECKISGIGKSKTIEYFNRLNNFFEKYK